MAEEKVIKAEKRETKGTSNAKRLRHAGKTPAVIYGSEGNLSITLDSHEFTLMVRDFGSNFIGDMVVDGAAPQKVLVKDIQFDPLSGDILHADFISVSMTETLQVSLPIELHGESAGEIAGGVMEQILSEIEIECLPGNMVENIVVDVSALEIGENLHVRDIEMPEGVKAVGDLDLVVASVAAPRVIAKDEEEAEGEAEAAEAEKPAE